jgi:LysM repeat protein
MSATARRLSAYTLGVLLVGGLLAGCTLAGANAAPLTPVGGLPTQDISQPQDVTSMPEPTDMAPIDVFGTQTAIAPTPELLEPTAESTPEPPSPETTEPTAEPSETTTPEATTEPSTGSAECPPTHTVISGENLFRIALRYGLTYQELAAANGITNPDALAVGTVLTIPGCGDTGTGSTGTGAAGERTHTVAAGENLYRIALSYGLTWQELAAYNGITNPDALSVGQVLRIPGE